MFDDEEEDKDFDRFQRERDEWEASQQKRIEKARSMRYRNNPTNEPVGHYTGRCMQCHSKNLWDDNHAYGCNDCGALYIT